MAIIDVERDGWHVTVNAEAIVAVVPDRPGSEVLLLVLHGETMELPRVVAEEIRGHWLAAQQGKADGD